MKGFWKKWLMANGYTLYLKDLKNSISEKKLRTPGLDNVKIRKNICIARGKKC